MHNDNNHLFSLLSPSVACCIVGCSSLGSQRFLFLYVSILHCAIDAIAVHLVVEFYWGGHTLISCFAMVPRCCRVAAIWKGTLAPQSTAKAGPGSFGIWKSTGIQQGVMGCALTGNQAVLLPLNLYPWNSNESGIMITATMSTNQHECTNGPWLYEPCLFWSTMFALKWQQFFLISPLLKFCLFGFLLRVPAFMNGNLSLHKDICMWKDPK